MVFVPYPSLSSIERVARAEPIDFEGVRIAPAEALRQAPNATGLLLLSRAGHPAYAVSRNGSAVTVSAESGATLPPLSEDEARSIAARFGGTPVAAVTGPFAYDQWVVFQGFDSARPFFRVSLADGLGTDLYVSAVTGQVLQRTTGAERFWNWPGSIVHWIYFTPLRKSFSAWDTTVWWLSLVGIVVTVAGVWLGLLAVMKVRRVRKAGLSPFRGWLHWHHLLGLFAGLFVFTWIFSGWLSMDHGRLFSTGQPADAMVARMQGMPLPGIASAVPVEALKNVASASEVSFRAVAGRPFLVARGDQTSARLYWLNSAGASPQTSLSPELLLNAVRSALPGSEVSLQRDQSAGAMYRLAEELPDEALLLQVRGPLQANVYVDGLTGQLLTVMDGSREAYAWLYYGLHTFNFPGLTDAPLLRRVLLLLPLFAGFVFSVTGVILGIKRLARGR